MGQVPQNASKIKDTEVMNENDGAVGKPVAGKSAPLLVLSRVTFKKLKLEIRSETHDQLTKYVTFYQQAAGVKPDESELVDAALVRAFQDDKGFQSFLSNGGGSRIGKSQPAVRKVPPGLSPVFGGAFFFIVGSKGLRCKCGGVVSKRKGINAGVLITAIMTGSAE